MRSKDAERTEQETKRTYAIERAVGVLGMLNLLTNVGIASITSILAMEANKSVLLRCEEPPDPVRARSPHGETHLLKRSLHAA